MNCGSSRAITVRKAVGAPANRFLYDLHSAMRYSTRQFLIAVTFVCLWLAAVARGNYLLGSDGAILFGVLAAGALFLLARLLFGSNGGKRSPATLVVFSLFGASMVYAVLIPEHVMRDYGHFAQRQEYRRQAHRLQGILDDDPRFADVSVVYVAPRRRRGEWLEVTGSVENAPDLEALNTIVEERDDWYVEWSVTTRDFNHDNEANPAMVSEISG